MSVQVDGILRRKAHKFDARLAALDKLGDYMDFDASSS
jgi:hypothetical protein